MTNLSIHQRSFNPNVAKELERAGCSPLLARLMAARGIGKASDIDCTLDKLIRPDSLLGLDKALPLLISAIKQKEKILIVGDYDCDGATATAMAVHFFRAQGVPTFYIVPNRETMGYGLSVKLAEIIIKSKPDLVITVDNGIGSHQGIEILRQNNIKVIITDHHLPADTLPQASAIINPNQGNCSFPSKNLAGVGVMFYVLIALRQQLIKNGFANFPLNQYLDLVALGTVADLVPLDKNNRLLVSAGIKLIRSSFARAGMRALINVAGVTAKNLSTNSISFFIAPRINAAGRLSDMTIGIETLLCEDEERALELARILNNINSERRQIEGEIKSSAMEILRQIKENQENKEELTYVDASPVNCLYNANWHLGVVGIVASRIKEQTYKPTFIFANANVEEEVDGKKEEIIRGSGRSVAGLHLRDCLDLMAKKNPQLFISFGGHAMAAGASIYKKNLQLFEQNFSQCAKIMSPQALQPIIETDGKLYPADFNLANIREIENNIWGQGFPPPLFYDSWVVEKWQNFKANHWKLQVKNERIKAKAIYFNAPEDFIPSPKNKEINFTFSLSVNEYQGQVEILLNIDRIIA